MSLETILIIVLIVFLLGGGGWYWGGGAGAVNAAFSRTGPAMQIAAPPLSQRLTRSRGRFLFIGWHFCRGG